MGVTSQVKGDRLKSKVISTLTVSEASFGETEFDNKLELIDILF